jgi:hypothetical protein
MKRVDFCCVCVPCPDPGRLDLQFSTWQGDCSITLQRCLQTTICT